MEFRDLIGDFFCSIFTTLIIFLLTLIISKFSTIIARVYYLYYTVRSA